VPDASFSSLNVVPDCPSMLISNFFTPSLLLPVCFPYLYSTVGHILHIVSGLSCKFPAHTCDRRQQSVLQVTGGLGENGKNVS